MKNIKPILAASMLGLFVVYLLVGRSSYSIGSEFCWVDPDLLKTKRVGLSLKVIDKKNDTIEFSLTHVMATDFMQSFTAKFNQLQDSVSEERLKGIIEKNTLTKGACRELYSQKEKLTALIKEEMRKQESLDAEVKLKKDAEDLQAQAKLAKSLEEAKERLKTPGEVFCVFDKADQYGKPVEYFLAKYIGTFEMADKTLKYEFSQGSFNSAAHKIEPEGDSKIWDLQQFVNDLPSDRAIVGKERCIAEIEKRHAEKIKSFNALNLKINQIICTPYSIHKIIGFENTHEGATSIGRPSAVLLPAVFNKTGRAIASDNSSKYYADEPEIKDPINKYNLNEAECLKKMQEENQKKKSKEIF